MKKLLPIKICVSKLTKVSTNVMYLPVLATMLSSNLNYLYGLHVPNEYIINDITQTAV